MEYCTDNPKKIIQKGKEKYCKQKTFLLEKISRPSARCGASVIPSLLRVALFVLDICQH